jgi:hypothetical protein
MSVRYASRHKVRIHLIDLDAHVAYKPSHRERMIYPSPCVRYGFLLSSSELHCKHPSILRRAPALQAAFLDDAEHEGPQVGLAVVAVTALANHDVKLAALAAFQQSMQDASHHLLRRWKIQPV